MHALPPLLFAGLALASAPPATASELASEDLAPRLVVVVVVDQLVPDQLERLEPWLDGGLGRFAREGWWLRRAAHAHAGTTTAPGHVTLMTGRYPAHHGIVSNSLYDREQRREVYAVADDDATPVGDRGPGRSPRSIRGEGLGDLLRAAHPGSRTVAIAGKDRAAIGLGGRHPAAVLWWSQGEGGFASSSWYGAELPAWVAEWNAGWPERVRAFDGAAVFDGSLPGSGTAEDERAGEAPSGSRRSFPYPPPSFSDTPSAEERAAAARYAFHGPLVDRFVLELAIRAVAAEGLGEDDEVDLLLVGLSACDVVGHRCGLYSREVTDVLLRADDELGTLFAELDRSVGSERWIGVLSADHGVLPLPERLVEAGVGARRVLDGPWRLRAAMRSALQERFEADFDVGFAGGGIAFDEEAARSAGAEPAEVRRVLRGVAEEAEWVARAFTREDLEAEGALEGPDPWRALAARSYFADRSPDLVVQARPWLLVGMPLGTTHGSPYPYDREVPLVFLGPGFEAGRTFGPAATVDLLPTVLARLGLPLPADLDGHVLVR